MSHPPTPEVGQLGVSHADTTRRTSDHLGDSAYGTNAGRDISGDCGNWSLLGSNFLYGLGLREIPGPPGQRLVTTGHRGLVHIGPHLRRNFGKRRRVTPLTRVSQYNNRGPCLKESGLLFGEKSRSGTDTRTLAPKKSGIKGQHPERD